MWVYIITYGPANVVERWGKGHPSLKCIELVQLPSSVIVVQTLLLTKH